MKYKEEDYKKAIEFALNYPPIVVSFHYNEDKDVYKVKLFDEGWYTIELDGFFVRSCLKWKGKKQWRDD